MDEKQNAITLDEIEELCLRQAKRILEKETAPTLVEVETVKGLVAVVIAGENARRGVNPQSRSCASALPDALSVKKQAGN